MDLEKQILNFMKKKNYFPLTKEELAVALDINFANLKHFFNILDSLIKSKKISCNDCKYSIYEKKKLLKGKIIFTPKGNAFFVSDDEIDDIFIPKNELNNANHCDDVEIEITKDKEINRKAEGRVVKVLNRNNNIIIGTFTENKNFGFVVPDDLKYNYDIFIKKGDKNGAKTDDKVICKITEYPDKKKNPEGVIIEVLGNKNNNNVQILSILEEMGIPYKFPNKLYKELEELEVFDIKKEIKNRVDFRKLFTVTIDGKDSKDFDDAISIEKKDNNYILYVHIADVSHFVKKDSKLDREAYKRGNSVYLFDYVVPMLPELLSNQLCSLNPNTDKLAITVKMTISNSGIVKDYKFYESVINSDYRLIYDDVSMFLDTNANNSNIYKDDVLKEKLHLMKELDEILTIKRKNRGTIDFELPEIDISFNKYGEVENISKKTNGVANRIIESFMVCANEVVGKHFGNEDIPIIYRLHPKPTEEKLEILKNYLRHLNINIQSIDQITPKFLSNIIEKFKDSNKSSFVNYTILRSMSKAQYSSNIDIHFGLATFLYCHFTSPIRRYADLTVHRTLKNYLHANNETTKNYLDYLDITSNHINDTEIIAIDAERKLEDIKKVEFMKNKIGQVFNGIIVSVTSFGIFVQLDNTVEGLVKYEDIADDYYEFNEQTLTAVGKRSRNVFDIGMEIEIIVAKVNEISNEIYFYLNR